MNKFKDIDIQSYIYIYIYIYIYTERYIKPYVYIGNRLYSTIFLDVYMDMVYMYMYISLSRGIPHFACRVLITVLMF